MEINNAVKTLSALAQETRLTAFRLLVQAGGPGLAAGDIARSLGIPHNTLSSHIAILANAGLVQAQRNGRSVIYRVNFDGTRALLGYLLEDCCQGSPDLCTPVVNSVLASCCASDTTNSSATQR